MNYSMHTLTCILLRKLVKLYVITQIKKNVVRKYRKKKQRTSLNKNVTDVYRSTKDLMSKKCEHFKSAMLLVLRKNKFAGHTCQTCNRQNLTRAGRRTKKKKNYKAHL